MQCECHWSCEHHDATWIGMKGTSIPWQWREDRRRCPHQSENCYVRVVCPDCEDFRIFVLCGGCYGRVLSWKEMGATYFCESCAKGVNSKDGWTAYKEAS